MPTVDSLDVHRADAAGPTASSHKRPLTERRRAVPILRRLQNRRMLQWSVAYATAAWIALQVSDFLAEHFYWPTSAVRIIAVVLGVGWLATLVLAWYHGEKGEQRVTGVELVLLTAILLGGVGVITMVDETTNGSGGNLSAAAVDADNHANANYPSLIVLPFVSMDQDGVVERLADGITEEVLNELGEIPGMTGPAHAATFSFKNREEDVRIIAEAIGVEYLIEGSIQRMGDRVRIAARLFDVRNRHTVWSQRYDRIISNDFLVQEEIARDVVSAVRLRFLGSATSSP